MKVALVTSEGRCGIAEHSAMLCQYVQAADPTIQMDRSHSWLDPADFLRWQNACVMNGRPDIDILHLNYHRGLHSRWTPEVVENLGRGHKVVITFHDTYETQPDSLLEGLARVADAVIVHEPISEMREIGAFAAGVVEKIRYWRQGVPEPPFDRAQYAIGSALRPYVGTCGFAFPWKGFELLCDAAAAVGWGILICSHNATEAQVLDWEARNPWVEVDRSYLSTPDLVGRLATCDATAFLYSCANSGTSGAIRLGIAAGKPLLATSGCRQFRDLQEDPDVQDAINWVTADTDRVAAQLAQHPLVRFDTAIVALRERDSWRHLGKKYADLYRSLVSA